MEGCHFWYDDEREPIELDGHGLIPYECHIKKAMERLLARHYSGAVLPKELEPYFSYEEYRKIFQTRCIMNTSTGWYSIRKKILTAVCQEAYHPDIQSTDRYHVPA